MALFGNRSLSLPGTMLLLFVGLLVGMVAFGFLIDDDSQQQSTTSDVIDRDYAPSSVRNNREQNTTNADGSSTTSDTGLTFRQVTLLVSVPSDAKVKIGGEVMEKMKPRRETGEIREYFRGRALPSNSEHRGWVEAHISRDWHKLGYRQFVTLPKGTADRILVDFSTLDDTLALGSEWLDDAEKANSSNDVHLRDAIAFNRWLIEEIVPAREKSPDFVHFANLARIAVLSAEETLLDNWPEGATQSINASREDASAIIVADPTDPDTIAGEDWGIVNIQAILYALLERQIVVYRLAAEAEEALTNAIDSANGKGTVLRQSGKSIEDRLASIQKLREKTLNRFKTN